MELSGTPQSVITLKHFNDILFNEYILFFLVFNKFLKTTLHFLLKGDT